MFRLELIDWRLVGRLTVTLFALSIFPVLLGMVIDRQLNSFPILTLFMLLLGLNLGVYTIARQVSALYLKISPIPTEPASESAGGDSC